MLLTKRDLLPMACILLAGACNGTVSGSDATADISSSRDGALDTGATVDVAMNDDFATPDVSSSDSAVTDASTAMDATAQDTAMDAVVDDVTNDVATTDTAVVDALSDAARDFSTNRMDFGLGGPSHCSTANVQLCEDFETGTLDTGTWHVSGTMPTIDGTHVARGMHALHISRNNNGASYIRETRTFPAMNNTYWGRAFFYFHALPQPAMGYAHWTFVAASGTGIPGEIRLSGQLSSGRNLFGVGTDSQGHTGDWTRSDNDPSGHPMAVPTDQWLCIEWLHSGQTNETRFFWDGTEHMSMYTSATDHGTGSGSSPGAQYIMPQFTQLWLGWQEYQTSTEHYELWLDEIAIDSARIGCVL
jgi:hypothetical protein